jgi:hypothetical protein
MVESDLGCRAYQQRIRPVLEPIFIRFILSLRSRLMDPDVLRLLLESLTMTRSPPSKRVDARCAHQVLFLRFTTWEEEDCSSSIYDFGHSRDAYDKPLRWMDSRIRWRTIEFLLFTLTWIIVKCLLWWTGNILLIGIIQARPQDQHLVWSTTSLRIDLNRSISTIDDEPLIRSFTFERLGSLGFRIVVDQDRAQI